MTHKPKISLIVGMANNNVIGADNQLPWHIPADLAWFKQHTLNKPIIMGRKTFESIGRPLPNRHNIVMSRTIGSEQGVTWVSSLEEALNAAGDVPEVMIIGGGSIYQSTLASADKLYVTYIDAEIEGDTYFPEIDPEVWQETLRECHTADDKNSHDYCFTLLERT